MAEETEAAMAGDVADAGATSAPRRTLEMAAEQQGLQVDAAGVKEGCQSRGCAGKVSFDRALGEAHGLRGLAPADVCARVARAHLTLAARRCFGFRVSPSKAVFRHQAPRSGITKQGVGALAQKIGHLS